MPWPWEKACRNQWAVNLPGPQGSAGAQEASKAAGRAALMVLPCYEQQSTQSLYNMLLGVQGWPFSRECDIHVHSIIFMVIPSNVSMV